MNGRCLSKLHTNRSGYLLNCLISWRHWEMRLSLHPFIYMQARLFTRSHNGRHHRRLRLYTALIYATLEITRITNTVLGWRIIQQPTFEYNCPFTAAAICNCWNCCERCLFIALEGFPSFHPPGSSANCGPQVPHILYCAAPICITF